MFCRGTLEFRGNTNLFHDQSLLKPASKLDGWAPQAPLKYKEGVFGFLHVRVLREYLTQGA